MRYNFNINKKANSLFFDKRSDGWIGQSWEEVAHKTHDLAKFLISIGIKSDERNLITSSVGMVYIYFQI